MLDYWRATVEPRIGGAKLTDAQLTLFATCCLDRAWKRLADLGRLSSERRLRELMEEAIASLKAWVNTGIKPREGLADAVNQAYPDPDDPSADLVDETLIHALNSLFRVGASDQNKHAECMDVASSAWDAIYRSEVEIVFQSRKKPETRQEVFKEVSAAVLPELNVQLQILAEIAHGQRTKV